jgi:hypothetical protein
LITDQGNNTLDLFITEAPVSNRSQHKWDRFVSGDYLREIQGRRVISLGRQIVETGAFFRSTITKT